MMKILKPTVHVMPDYTLKQRAYHKRYDCRRARSRESFGGGEESDDLNVFSDLVNEDEKTSLSIIEYSSSDPLLKIRSYIEKHSC